MRSDTNSSDTPELVFLFPGQGSQYYQMGRALFDADPAFRDLMTGLDAHYAQQRGVALLARLYGSRSGFSPPSWQGSMRSGRTCWWTWDHLPRWSTGSATAPRPHVRTFGILSPWGGDVARLQQVLDLAGTHACSTEAAAS